MKAKVTHENPGIHPKLGKLEHGQMVELPDGFRFEGQDLFGPVDSAVPKIQQPREKDRSKA